MKIADGLKKTAPIALCVLLLGAGCAWRGKTTFIASGAFAGGVVTDGAEISGITWRKTGTGERLEISVRRWAGYGPGGETAPLERPCYFRVESEAYPWGLRVFFGGARAFSAYRALSALNEELRDSSLVRNVYPVVTLDDSAGEIGVTLKAPARFAVYELRRPARIVIDLVPSRHEEMPGTAFSLRTLSGVGGEQGGHLRERLAAATGRPARMLIDERGEYLVEAGCFPTEIEARAARAEIRRKLPDFWDLAIEARGPAALPAYLDRRSGFERGDDY